MNHPPHTQYLPPHCVEPDPTKPPKRYSASLLNRLADDIKKRGVRPVRVREVAGRWFAVSSDELQRQACLAAGLEAMPCTIVERGK